MSEKPMIVTWHTGVSILPERMVRVRPEAAQYYLGMKVEIADDLPPGVLAVMGHRNPDGSFEEGAVRLVEG